MRKAWIPLLLAALLTGHFWWVSRSVTPAYASPDADGYFAEARLLAEEQRVTFRAESDLQYVGVHWLEVEDRRFISRYPPGFPALLAVAWVLGGRDATFWVNPALATLTLLFLFLLCRPWTGAPLALVAALVFAAHPLANYHAIHADSHTSATCFLVAGLWLLDRWGRRPTRPAAFVAGLVLGMVPAIRPAEVTAGIGIGLFVAWGLLRRRRGAVWTLAGALVPVGLLLLHNQVELGGPLRTGYSLTNEQQSLGLDHLAANWESYLDTLMLGGGAGLFFALGVAGLAAMVADRGTRLIGLSLLLVIVPITAGYALYYWGGSARMQGRFLLPTLPLYLLPALRFLRVQTGSKAGRIALLALVAVTVGRGVHDSIDRLGREYEGAKRSALALGWIERHIPAGSILVADRRLLDQVHFTGRWRLADSSILAGSRRPGGFGFGRRRGAGSGRPSPMQAGKAETMHRRYRDLPPGERSLVALNDLLDWAGKDRGVYWIGSRRDVDRFDDITGGAEQFHKVGEFTIPSPPRRPAPPRGGIGRLFGGLRRFARNIGASMFALRPGKREVFELAR